MCHDFSHERRGKRGGKIVDFVAVDLRSYSLLSIRVINKSKFFQVTGSKESP